jgi:hypothetical protein
MRAKTLIPHLLLQVVVAFFIVKTPKNHFNRTMVVIYPSNREAFSHLFFEGKNQKNIFELKKEMTGQLGVEPQTFHIIVKH